MFFTLRIEALHKGTGQTPVPLWEEAYSQLSQSLGGFLFDQGVEHRAQIPFVENFIFAELLIEPLVGDDVVLIPIDADLLRSPASPNLGVPTLGSLLLDLLAFDLVDPGSEQSFGLFTVLGLGFGFLHPDFDAGGFVDHVDCGGDFVDILPAGALGGGDVFLDIARPIDIDLDGFWFGQDRDGAGARVHPPLSFSRGDAFN